ncbi:hypothetical protein SDC9_146593 [bioreactor metagenome]|uniref:Uncharacterized protein n=1 Tax=bioreactor metagenome TaxID=1076179 RepID=A0A645EFM9_9ZZZZ
MEWNRMLTVLKSCSKSSILTIYWGNGLIIKGVIDTFSETDNSLEEDDPDYKEYYMCVIKIADIVRLPNQGPFNEKVGDLIEVSILNEPIKIEEKGKGIIWEK